MWGHLVKLQTVSRWIHSVICFVIFAWLIHSWSLILILNLLPCDQFWPCHYTLAAQMFVSIPGSSCHLVILKEIVAWIQCVKLMVLVMYRLGGKRLDAVWILSLHTSSDDAWHPDVWSTHLFWSLQEGILFHIRVVDLFTNIWGLLLNG